MFSLFFIRLLIVVVNVADRSLFYLLVQSTSLTAENQPAYFTKLSLSQSRNAAVFRLILYF